MALSKKFLSEMLLCNPYCCDLFLNNLPAELNKLGHRPIELWILKTAVLSAFARRAGVQTPELALSKALSEITTRW
jgi:hypothetical protein